MNYSTASLDELYGELSRELGGELGLGDGTPAQGKVIFDRAWSQVCSTVCGNPTVRVLAEDRRDLVADYLNVGALLATAFTGIFGQIVNVSLLVAIVGRIGVKTLCKEHWAEQDKLSS